MIFWFAKRTQRAKIFWAKAQVRVTYGCPLRGTKGASPGGPAEGWTDSPSRVRNQPLKRPKRAQIEFQPSAGPIINYINVTTKTYKI